MYNNYIEINDKFKPSINLNYDLNNIEKIEQFIPTSDLCDVIKQYIKCVLTGEGRKSSLLAGPYGKGKSYLILIVSYLLGKRENKNVLFRLISKIEKVDLELSQMIKQIEKENIHLLPVIINNNDSSDLSQNFMIALNNSLSINDIESLVPNTAFSECLKLIETWKNIKSFDVYKECRDKLKMDLSSLENDLKYYNQDAYKNFCQLFQCINHGYLFNPLVTNDIGKTYEDVCLSLSDYDYNGLFVVYDEFGVVLENQGHNFVSSLNKIQAFAEKANGSSRQSPLLFCCIIHKDIGLYNTDNKYVSEFEKIAGRFKQLRFNRSLEENYQILCGAIKKKEGYDELFSKKFNKHFFDKLWQSTIFTSKEIVHYIYKNGFPLNPVTIYSLVQLSEKISQNERTLFTYISDNDRDGFKSFISNNEENLLNVDSLYDYFFDQIKDNNEYNKIQYKAEALLRTIDNKVKRSIIKVIAVMQIINDDIRFMSSLENISLALGKSEEEIKQNVDLMIRDNILKQNFNNKSIDFTAIIDDVMNSVIDRMINNSISRKTALHEMLYQIDANKYFKSSKYNFEYLMTRYYKVIYLESSLYKELSTLSYFEENNDGLIVNIINDDNSTLNDLVPKSNEIIQFAQSEFDDEIIHRLHKYNAINQIIHNNSNLSKTALEALIITKDDIKYEIQTYLNNRNNNSIILWNGKKYENINNAIYDSLSYIYNKMVILNNEQINKHEISSVITKARNNVVDNILDINDKQYKDTSAEGAILISFNDSLKQIEAIELLEAMKGMLISQSKVNMKEIIDYLLLPPIGMRKGIIPLFLAKAIKSLKTGNEVENNILLYSGNTEIKLDAINLSKMVDSPNDYYISCKEIDNISLTVVDHLIDILELDKQEIFIDNVTLVVAELKKIISNLDLIIIKTTRKENLLSLSNNAIIFKDVLIKRESNTYELLFETLIKKLKIELIDLPTVVKNILKEYKNKKAKYEKGIIDYTLEVFSARTLTIKESYHVWKGVNENIKNIHFDGAQKEIYNALEDISNNNSDAIKSLTYAAVGSTINDFNSTKEVRFKQELIDFKKMVERYKDEKLPDKDVFEIDNSIEISVLGKTLESNLEAIVQEYGEAVPNKEKAYILKKILKKL